MKSIWIVFAVVALVVISCSAVDAPEQTNEPPDMRKLESVDILRDVYSNQAVMQVPPSFEGARYWVSFGGVQCHLIEDVQCDTADRAYKKAITLLATIRDSPPTHKAQSTHTTSSGILSKVLSSIIPSPHGQGPFSSAIRIAMKLRHQSWFPRILRIILGLNVDGRDEDPETSEGYRNTATVIALLRRAISLGHTDAMFTLASLSLVRYILPDSGMEGMTASRSFRLPPVTPLIRSWHLRPLIRTPQS